MLLSACDDPAPTPMVKTKADCTVDYVAAFEGIYFKENTPLFTEYGSVSYQDGYAPRNETLIIDGESFVLNYLESNDTRYGNLNTYTSGDQNILYKYHRDTENPFYLEIQEYDMTKISTFKTEEEYIECSKAFIKSYCSVNFDEYDYSCITVSESNHRYDGFKDDLGIDLDRYCMSFTKCFGGIETSDKYVVEIYPLENKIKITFDCLRFAKYEELNVDSKELDDALDEFMRSNTKRGFISYEIYSKYLTFNIDGTLVANYGIDVNDGYWGYSTGLTIFLKVAES